MHTLNLPSVESQPATIDGKFFFACLKPYKQELRMGVKFSFMDSFFGFTRLQALNRSSFASRRQNLAMIFLVSGACELAFFQSR